MIHPRLAHVPFILKARERYTCPLQVFGGKKMEKKLQSIWDEYQDLYEQYKEKENALNKVARLKTALAAANTKNKELVLLKKIGEEKFAKDLAAEKKDALDKLTELQSELAVEKENAIRNKNTCIVCNKEYFKFCGIDCLK